MVQRWKELRGEELSAYAASPASKNQRGAFVRHLRKYGSPADFNNFIVQKHQPIEKCVEFYADFPRAAQAWLLDALSNTADKAHTHYLTAYFVLSHIKNLSQFRTPLEEVIKNIQLDNVDVSDHKILLPFWITKGYKNVVKNHWDIYESILRDDLALHPKSSKMYTSEGVDLEADIAWKPKTEEQYLEHFISCCSGGLLHRVQQYPVAQKQTGALLQAFYLAAFKSHGSVLEHLWETYPSTPWHKAESVLRVIDKLSPSMAEKLLKHMRDESPRFDEQIFLALNGSIVDKQEKAIELLFTHLKPIHHHKILPLLVSKKRTKLFEHILNHPHGDQQFSKALDIMNSECIVRAHSMRNALQNRLLREQTKDYKKEKSVSKRKM